MEVMGREGSRKMLPDGTDADGDSFKARGNAMVQTRVGRGGREEGCETEKSVCRPQKSGS